MSAADWLRTLIRERLSPQLALRLTQRPQHGYEITYGEKSVAMPKWEWGLGTVVSAHCWFDAEAEGWQSCVGGPLPAPGVGELCGPVTVARADGYDLRYDVLGLACWMLSRAEEVGRSDLDEHERFPATSSHAFRNGYLERPVVDEWFALLRQIAERVWPNLPLVETRAELDVSHDVDVPSEYAFRPLAQLGRSLTGDMLKRRDVAAAAKRAWIYFNSRRRLHPRDSYNTFDWLMGVSERQGLTSTFNFVCGRTDAGRDPSYEIEHPAIRELLRRIHNRGHSIGAHPSYGTYRNPDAMAREAQRLLQVCTAEGVTQDVWGGRMHYLRWQTPTTSYGWARAGMTYDGTLGYADRPGFRCGTCIDYPTFDPVRGESLSLRVQPLIAMESTVMSNLYLGLGVSPEAYDKFMTLKRTCSSVGGRFALLWHNSELLTRESRDLYQAVVTA